jgi:thioesterase domain-containing protein/acyl carrier protein
LLLNSGWKGNPRVKVICHGEELQSDLATRLVESCGSVWNVYGMAEVAFAATLGRVHSGKDRDLGRSIGKMVLVDSHCQQVPIGVPGEIMVSGKALARGYHNLPQLNGEFFVDWPAGESEAQRFYRTGDIGRYRPDGKIDFLGRRDHHSATLANPVRTNEVETVLRGHPAVKDVAICFPEDTHDKLPMVAYVEAKNGASANLTKEMDRLVRGELPEYMRPSRFVLVEEMPRLADGRVDRRALPETTGREMDLEDYAQPRNGTEERLVKIWQELLGVQRVSVKDSFFDLGGKSLLAVRLFVRIEEEFGRKLPLATLFRTPTLEGLAELLAGQNNVESKWPSLVPIQSEGRRKPLFLVHGAGGNVLLYGALAKRLEPEYPLYGLQSQGLDGESEPLRTIEEMAARYIDEIKTVQHTGPYVLGGYCLGGTVAYEMAQRLLESGENVAAVIMLDTYNFSKALRGNFASFLLQKVRFHCGNVLSLRPDKMLSYLKAKTRNVSEGGWDQIRTEMPGSTLEDGVARAESGVEASVQEINDHAADIYCPKPYAGRLIVFKPQINYKFYPDPKMGWEGLALGGLDIVELPMYPHAMLVEPYVELLATELKARLNEVG